MDRTPAGTSNINYAILTINMANYSTTNNGIYLSFSWAHFNEDSNPNDRVWIRGSVTDPWVEVYDLDPLLGVSQEFIEVSGLNVVALLASASPAQQLSESFQVRFGQEGTNPTSADGICFDNIRLEEVACETPSNLVATSVKGIEAELDWTENGSSSTWQIKLGLTGFDPASESPVTVTSNPYNWTGLSVNTTYDWYIRSDCGNGNYSGWAGPHTFTTKPCDLSPVTLPYVMNFEAPSGTATQDVYICGPAYYWSFETDQQGQGRARFGNQAVMSYAGSGAVTMDRKTFGGTVVNSAILTIDLSNYLSSSNVGMSFYYADHDDESNDGDKIWIRQNDDHPWIELYDLDPGNVSNDNFQMVFLEDFDDILAANSQAFSDYFQIRFGQEGTDPTFFGGITFDNVVVDEFIPPQVMLTGDHGLQTGGIDVYSNNRMVCIRSHGKLAAFKKQVWIYDMFGREVLRTTLLSSSLDRLPIGQAKGYLVVKVLAGNELVVERVLIE
jgi:hypothetical protein